MDTWTFIRLMAHIILIAWSAAAAILLTLARGKSVQITHIHLAVAGLTLFILWLSTLVLTMRTTGIFPREALIPILACLELSAGICAWSWLILSMSYAFQVCLPRKLFNLRLFR